MNKERTHWRQKLRDWLSIEKFLPKKMDSKSSGTARRCAATVRNRSKSITHQGHRHEMPSARSLLQPHSIERSRHRQSPAIAHSQEFNSLYRRQLPERAAQITVRRDECLLHDSGSVQFSPACQPKHSVRAHGNPQTETERNGSEMPEEMKERVVNTTPAESRLCNHSE